jgi:hypothetical protein
MRLGVCGSYIELARLVLRCIFWGSLGWAVFIGIVLLIRAI